MKTTWYSTLREAVHLGNHLQALVHEDNFGILRRQTGQESGNFFSTMMQFDDQMGWSDSDCSSTTSEENYLKIFL